MLEVVDIQTESQRPDVFLTREAAAFARHFKSLQELTQSIVPPRSAFTPSSARALLPYVSILEYINPELVLVRLVGTAIVSRTRINNTGRNMLDLMPADIRAGAMIGFRELLATPCGATYFSHETYENGPIPIEIVSFPFANARGVPHIIISLSVEIDRQELMLRGEARMKLSSVFDKRIIDIGAGRPRA